MPIYANIFCTVGTTHFDRLCSCITSDNILEIIKTFKCRKLTVQIGYSNLEPTSYNTFNIEVDLYRFKDSIAQDIEDADLVISHAGAGSCLEVLEARKPLLVVVNEKLMDNHQLELAEQLQIDGHLYYCTCDTLDNTLQSVDFNMLKPFPKPETGNFVKFLDSVIVNKC